MTANTWTEEDNVVYIYKEIVSINKAKWSHDIYIKIKRIENDPIN